MKDIKVNDKWCTVEDGQLVLPVGKDKVAVINKDHRLDVSSWQLDNTESTTSIRRAIDYHLVQMAGYENPFSSIHVFFGKLYKHDGNEPEYYGRFTKPQSLLVQKEGGAYHSGAIANSLLGMMHDKMDEALIEAKQLIALDQMDLGDWFGIVGDICIVFESTCLKYWEDINPKPPVLVKTPEAPSGVVYAPYVLEEHCSTIGNVITIDPKYMLDESTERYSRCFQVN